MVESCTAKATEMALKLSTVHRWARFHAGLISRSQQASPASLTHKSDTQLGQKQRDLDSNFSE